MRLPDRGLTVDARDEHLRIAGLTHGQEIAVTLRRDLPAANGEILARDDAISGYIRDRSPAVRFPGRVYVLP
ncbi:hypothetical protein [Loktanella atrilutea]|uniref:hypothetical protein n=1 Tax=Loktanella atrilutea TaxID=366533 RepID=UPI00093413BF|nr:hypothetical protein [Loktanella atrilutea]